MRKFKVHHEPLPGVGELLRFTTASGVVMSVVSYRSGRRDVSVGVPGADDTVVTVPLSRSESLALATLLTGSHIELVAAPKP